MPNALTFETDRLVLRPHVRDDFDDTLAMWSDPDVTRFINGKPSTREEVWARLLRYIGHWTLLGFGFWVVREKATGRFLGEVGFADFHRDIEPSHDGLPEIGWALARHAHGQGFATEAVQGALRWSDTEWPGRETVCIVAPENMASLRVAAKCGFVERTRTSYKTQPIIVLRRNAGDA
ncbi:GNAT family N-acetyltransferase [Paraburkholderia sp.]|uniref:GNAT family N-acetyltransferase n=1 Tax=Paraburkholderia sp. TaxID=1926495 RepID=UPI003D6F842F